MIMLTPSQIQTLRSRLLRWIVIHPQTNCWLWSGATKENRNHVEYGRVSFRVFGEKNPRAWSAHVVSFWVFNNRMRRTGYVVSHKCDTPLCINPDHLEERTQRTNIRQCVEKGRHVPGGKPRVRAELNGKVMA